MRFLLSSILLILLSQAPAALASRAAYVCSSPATTGTFAITDDCTLSGEVSLSGDLDILGVPKEDGSYPVITAATGSRHFKIDSGAHKLTLKYLKMTGGNPSNPSNGGSIRVHNVAAHLNISHCVFFQNTGGYSGGAIYAVNNQPELFFSFVSFIENTAGYEGGAVLLRYGTLVEHSCTYTANTAAKYGGAIDIKEGSQYSSFDSLFVNNTAGDRGGGINIYGESSTPSFVDLSSVTLQSNKQTSGGTYGDYGGGGLSLLMKVTVNIRESTFIENEATEGATGDKHGHQIFTFKYDPDIPIVTIVNTQFTHIAENNAFYGYDGSNGGADKYVSPAVCGANPCTVSPFDGDCTELGNNEGVTCDYGTSCSAYQTQRAILPLPPPEDPCECSEGFVDTGSACECAAGTYTPDGNSCLPHTTCGNQLIGSVSRLTDASATAAGT